MVTPIRMSSELSAASARYDIILRSIPRQVPTAVFQSLVVALVLSRLDYCNNVLVGLPANLIRRLHSVQNTAARLIFGIRWSEHITQHNIADVMSVSVNRLLCPHRRYKNKWENSTSLHWLRVPKRILFKVAVLTYWAVNGSAPVHLSSYFTRPSHWVMCHLD